VARSASSLGSSAVVSSKGLTVRNLNCQHDAARESYQRSLEISPKQSITAAFEAYASLLQGQPASALPISQRAAAELFRHQGAALADHDLGNAKEAQQSLNELISKSAITGAYQIAEVYAWTRRFSGWNAPTRSTTAASPSSKSTRC
jgi:tetratricopeptide (TPR) repeat protein